MNNGLNDYRAIIMVPYQVKVQAHGINSAAEHVKTKLDNIAKDYTIAGLGIDKSPIAPTILSIEKQRR